MPHEHDPDVETTERTRLLERPMTDDERLDVGAEMSKAIEAALDAERRKRELDARLKKDIEYFRGMADDLARVLLKGVKEGAVPVQETKDWRTGRIAVHRIDTGELLEERAMTFDERQRTLPGTAQEARHAQP